MATIIAGEIKVAGLEKMVKGLSQEASLFVIAQDISAQETYSVAVSYANTTTGVVDINNPVSLTIPEGGHIDNVRLRSTDNLIATSLFAEVATSIDFPNGGSLIVESFRLTVAAVAV